MVRKRHLRIIRGEHNKSAQRHRRIITIFEWIADVHLFVYPLLVVAFFWYLQYGHR